MEENQTDWQNCEKQIDALIDFEFFKALFDPVRSELVRYLILSGPKSIQEIAQNFSQDRSVISRHLDILYRQGVLRKKKQSRFVIYEVDECRVLDQFEKTSVNIRFMMEECKPKGE